MEFRVSFKIKSYFFEHFAIDLNIKKTCEIKYVVH